MTAPTVTKFFSGVAATSTTGPFSAAAGDLIIAVVANPSGTTPTMSLFDGAGTPTVISGASGLAAQRSDDDGTRALWLFAFLLTATPAGGTCDIRINNWSGSGTGRRLLGYKCTPPAGAKWANATAQRYFVDDANRIITGYTNPAWGIAWVGAGGSSNEGSFAVAATHSGTAAAMNADFEDGSGSSFEISTGDTLSAAGVTTAQNFYGATYAANDLGNNANLAFGGQRVTMAVLGAVWVMVPTIYPTNGRGNVAIKAGGGRAIRRRQARGNVAIKTGGKFHINTGVWIRGGRGNVAIKAGGTPNRTKRAGGRARLAVDGFTSRFNVLFRLRAGRGNVAIQAKAAGHISRHVRPARGNVAIKSGAKYRVFRRHGSAPRLAIGAKGAGHVIRRSQARGRVAIKAGGIGHILHTKARKGVAALVLRATGRGTVVHGPVPKTITLEPAVNAVNLEPASPTVGLEPAETHASLNV
jgi:hypothetical protein